MAMTQSMLRAALEMHQPMVELSRQYGRELSAHIGAAGNVVFSPTSMGALKSTEFTLTGDSVNLASRFADEASGTETLMTRFVHQALSEKIDCEPLDSLTVRGVDRPIEVYRLRGFLDHGVDHPLIGRAAELADFSGILSDFKKTGRGSVIALVAEAGLGMSRLMEGCARVGAEAQFRVRKALVLDFGLSDVQNPLRLLLTQHLGLGVRAEASAVRAIVRKQQELGTIDAMSAMFLTRILGTPLTEEERLVHDVMSDGVRQDESPLLKASLIRTHDHGYLIDHALIHDAVLRTTLREDLRALHLRAAAWFRQTDLLRHAEHLAAAQDDGAAQAFLTAAREAEAVHRKEVTLGLTERGLTLSAQDTVRGALLCLKGDMLRDLGRANEAIAGFEAARAVAVPQGDQCRARIGVRRLMS